MIDIVVVVVVVVSKVVDKYRAQDSQSSIYCE